MRLKENLGFVAMGFMVWIIFPAIATLAQGLPSPKPFLVFDATLYANKPDLSAHGLQPITIAYTGTFGPNWYQSPDLLPNIEAVQSVARNAQQKGHRVVLDIEHWPLEGTPSSVQDSLSKYLQVLTWFRDAAPSLSLGYYGAPPLRDYWRAIKDATSPERQSWMAANDQLPSLVDAVDILYPSLYTFYPDQAGWKVYAIAQIEEARRSGAGKPVYVFLMPIYHDSNPSLGGTYIPAAYWQLELETARQYADGIVIWGGLGSGNRPAKWDENAPWWDVTKKFLKNGEQSPPIAPASLKIY
jgi:hypothetical protein